MNIYDSLSKYIQCSKKGKDNYCILGKREYAFLHFYKIKIKWNRKRMLESNG